MLKWLRKQGRPLARFGCVSIGTVYVLVGVFALNALTGLLIEVADEDRIVSVSMGVPGGAIVIWGIVLGSAGYVLSLTAAGLGLTLLVFAFRMLRDHLGALPDRRGADVWRRLAGCGRPGTPWPRR